MRGDESPIQVVRRVVECDNGRDAAGYRALLRDDYQSFVHGQPSTSGPDEEVKAIQSWWSASRSHLSRTFWST